MTAAAEPDAPARRSGGAVGTVARLQVQRGRLKPGPRASRAYDPAPLLTVDALHVGPRGCLGVHARGWLVDVHHADHPDSRRHTSGRNPVSVMTTAGYAALRARFGPHLADGVAGESLLVDSPLLPADLVGRVLAVGDPGGPDGVLLDEVAVASPCVEFARYAAGLPAGSPVDDDLLAVLAALDGGARGVYAVPRGEAVLRPGVPVLLAG